MSRGGTVPPVSPSVDGTAGMCHVPSDSSPVLSFVSSSPKSPVFSGASVGRVQRRVNSAFMPAGHATGDVGHDHAMAVDKVVCGLRLRDFAM